ncbi:MAG: copper homeostasis protein CutC, partial [Bacteroidales bacterium]|nr:copper homeostasis protein CutC [Bacteroidales bacterium]
EALSAQARGAGRIELCADLSVGGLTPPRDLIREVVASLTIPVNVLIRPVVPGCSLPGRRAPRDPSQASLGPSLLQCRGWHGPWREHSETTGTDIRGGFSLADFVYDEAALQEMVDDIAFCKSVGAAGIVVGALTPDGAIDLPAMRQLLAAAAPLPVTFHRAFDVCTSDPFVVLDELISLGCARLLSSGRKPTAWEGRDLLASMVSRAPSLIIMPGSGITAANLSDLAAVTKAREYHGTRIP